MERDQRLRRKHEKEKVLCLSWWPPCRGLTWHAGQPNDSRGARDDGRGGEPLLKPGSVGPCPIDGFRRVGEISTSCRHNGRSTQDDNRANRSEEGDNGGQIEK